MTIRRVGLTPDNCVALRRALTNMASGEWMRMQRPTSELPLI